jgi:DEAD/DEAH box helicase domain-containing protein
MDVDAFLNTIRTAPGYAGQIVFVHEQRARAGVYVPARDVMAEPMATALEAIGIRNLYRHQAEAVNHVEHGRDVLIATGTASGKSLCYVLPILQRLRQNPAARCLLLFPTKALCQDQFRTFSRFLDAAGPADCLAGVYDGDTPAALRRRLRDRGRVIFSNPDMLHAGLMPQHGRWADFLGGLDLLVLDELHTYSGIFGSNAAHLFRRLFRLCRHYGSAPQIVACSATIANPIDLARRLTGRHFTLIDQDGSPCGRKVYVLWNPPRVRHTAWRSRRSANVEAHELMARLVADGMSTITFSKARMTAEMIHRYVVETLRETAPQQAAKVTPYRGGYRPSERRAIEARLFDGALLGVSTTRALELGIDVGSLEACIVVGYPGTRASFFQQAGRAGRKERDSIVFLIGLDTSVNQYIMSHPDYIFDVSIEEAVIDPENPFVVMEHLRCATHELPVAGDDVPAFGPAAPVALEVLAANRKVREIDGRWYHTAREVPQHEISLRDRSGANVLIQSADSGEVLGEVDRLDAEPLVHPEAVYMHLGETYRVLSLDLDRNIATVRREELDYYTQALGGTNVHHIDQQLRRKQAGSASVFWGEVTAYANTYAYEKVHFYSLDAVSVHGLDLPTMAIETMALWIVPPEALMERVRRAGLDAHSGLRGIGYATRMMLPLFMTCDTLDFSHTVGSANSPWNAVFIYERYPLGQGYTEKAYERIDTILPAVLDLVRGCACDAGCPCCVGKPLRQYATWNVERGEASIPSKASAVMILEGILESGMPPAGPDSESLQDAEPDRRLRLERALRRRLEREREPQVFHPILPMPDITTSVPAPEAELTLGHADATERVERRRSFERDLRRRLAKKMGLEGLAPETGRVPKPPGMQTRHGNLRPGDFPGKPVKAGDDLAARARKVYKKKRQPGK